MKCLGKGDASRRLKGSTGSTTTYLGRKGQNILMRSSREISAKKRERERKRKPSRLVGRGQKGPLIKKSRNPKNRTTRETRRGSRAQENRAKVKCSRTGSA